mgnify:CR=1 FL=1
MGVLTDNFVNASWGKVCVGHLLSRVLSKLRCFTLSAPIPAFPRQQGKVRVDHLLSRMWGKLPRNAPSPVRGGGLGWGSSQTTSRVGDGDRLK